MVRFYYHNNSYYVVLMFTYLLYLFLGPNVDYPTCMKHLKWENGRRSFVSVDDEESHEYSIISHISFPSGPGPKDDPNRIINTIDGSACTILCSDKRHSKRPYIKVGGVEYPIHRCVALLFGVPNNTGVPMTAENFGSFQVDHFDQNPKNWDISNLHWVQSDKNLEFYNKFRKKCRFDIAAQNGKYTRC